MRERRVVELLKRIAMGLPVTVGPLVLGLASTGCTHCYDLPLTGSTHERSSLTESLVGTPERFDPTGCNTLCRTLDGLQTFDAGTISDAGPRIYLGAWREERVVATCVYFESGSRLSCNYTERWCEVSGSCHPTVYGRTPNGLFAGRSLESTPLARWLAEGAHLEAASVPAFEDLAAELDAFGATSHLVSAARRSADDERRHAQQLQRFADRLGARMEEVRRSETGLRSPEEVAIDNATEGCGRETYGAIGAAYQAQYAQSREVRRVYRGIAADEARHALLSFAANDWLRSQLSMPARRRVDEARVESLAALAVRLEQEPDHTLVDVMGLPDATRANDLLWFAI